MVPLKLKADNLMSSFQRTKRTIIVNVISVGRSPLGLIARNLKKMIVGVFESWAWLYSNQLVNNIHDKVKMITNLQA